VCSTDNVKGQDWYQADEVAEEYEDVRFSGGGELIDQREKEAVLSALGPIEEGHRVLEVACGTGRFTTMLADQGAHIVGIDISREMLEQGRQKAAEAGLSDTVEFVRGDASRLPFPDDHFDTVVAMRFFHLMDDPAPFLAELCRVSSIRCSSTRSTAAACGRCTPGSSRWGPDSLPSARSQPCSARGGFDALR